MKKITAVILLICIMSALLSGCAETEASSAPGEDEISLLVNSTVPDRLTAISVRWCVDADVKTTETVQNADSNGCLEQGKFSFTVYSVTLGETADPAALGIRVSVTEKSGAVVQVSAPELALAPGGSYELELKYEDGCYSLWDVM